MQNIPKHPGDEVLNYIDQNFLIVWATGAIFSIKTKKWIGTKSNGCSVHDGYARIVVRGKFLKYHHVVWYMTRRYWPDKQVDHIDGKKNNHRPDNFRMVTDAENQAYRNERLRAKKNDTMQQQMVHI